MICFHYAEGSQVDQKNLQKLQDHCTVPFRHLDDQGTGKSVCPCIFQDYLYTNVEENNQNHEQDKGTIKQVKHHIRIPQPSHALNSATVSKRCPAVLDVPLI